MNSAYNSTGAVAHNALAGFLFCYTYSRSLPERLTLYTRGESCTSEPATVSCPTEPMHKETREGKPVEISHC